MLMGSISFSNHVCRALVCHLEIPLKASHGQPLQPVEAKGALNLSAGVSKSNVFSGLSTNSQPGSGLRIHHAILAMLILLMLTGPVIADICRNAATISNKGT